MDLSHSRDHCEKNTKSDTRETSKHIQDVTFDEIIGHIEDLLVDNEFQIMLRTFLERHWQAFEPIEENKLIYMDIFNEYNKTIENYIECSLQKAIPHFCMDTLLHQLNFALFKEKEKLKEKLSFSEKHPELDGEVFEVLATFTDFLAFKEMFLDYRAVKDGKVQDLSSGMSITSIKLQSSDGKDVIE